MTKKPKIHNGKKKASLINGKWKEKVGKSLELIGTGGNSLNKTPVVAHALRLRVDKWDLMKLESFCKAKDIVNKKSLT